MMTVVTTMKLQPSSAADWDQLIEERFRSAHHCDGWISGQLLSPADAEDTRVIVGTWRSKADWDAWHEDPAFLATKRPLDEIESEAHSSVWFDVIDLGIAGEH